MAVKKLQKAKVVLDRAVLLELKEVRLNAEILSDCLLFTIHTFEAITVFVKGFNSKLKEKCLKQSVFRCLYSQVYFEVN